jgi:hypothetical protein
VRHGPLQGVWFRVRDGDVDFDRKGGSSNNVRVMISYELPVLEKRNPRERSALARTTAQVNSASNALAACNSFVSNPSVNQL